MIPRAGVLAAAIGALAGCGAPAPPARRSAPPSAPSPASRDGRLGPRLEFRGVCDASGAELIGGRVAVADDEQNLLAVYPPGGGDPLQRLDLGRFLELGDDAPEADLEATAALGDRVYVVASHGRKRSGKLAPSRLRLFAIRPAVGPGGDLALEQVGHAYGHLIDDLVAAPALAGYGLAAAAGISPKQPGGLNVEGAGGVGDAPWLGLRSPLIDGRALLVELRAPERMLAGAPAVVARHVLLDLDGRGVRAIAPLGDELVVAAGRPVAEPLATRLYRWSPGAAAAAALDVDLGDLNVEAIAPLAARSLLLLSDDGARPIDGTPCKRQDPARRSFRGVRLDLEPVADPPKAPPR